MFGQLGGVWTAWGCLDSLEVFGRLGGVWTAWRCLDSLEVFGRLRGVLNKLIHYLTKVIANMPPKGGGGQCLVTSSNSVIWEFFCKNIIEMH